MGDRGRTSGSELATIGNTGIVDTVRRAEVPAHLGPEQAVEWRAIVNRLPAEWFPRETLALLESYCNHVVEARHIQKMCEQYQESDEFDVKEYKTLRQMYELESRAASSLATRMRLTQQSTYDKEKKKPKSGVKPWES